jgi:predicted nucleotidyltransferase
VLNRLKGVFASFQKHEVKYLVIGGIAAILHGVPRATFDLDILIEASPPNAQRLLTALLEAELGTASLITPEELLANEITVFKDRVRIDVQTSTPGLVFSQAWNRRISMTFQGQSFYVVSKEDLIATKKAAGREIDLSDVNLLGKS